MLKRSIMLLLLAFSFVSAQQVTIAPDSIVTTLTEDDSLTTQITVTNNSDSALIVNFSFGANQGAQQAKRAFDYARFNAALKRTEMGETGIQTLFDQLMSVKQKAAGDVRVLVYAINSSVANVVNTFDGFVATTQGSYTAADLNNYDILMNIRQSNLLQNETLAWIAAGGSWIGEWQSNDIPINEWGVIAASSNITTGTIGTSSTYVSDPNHPIANAIDWSNAAIGTGATDFMRDLRNINDPDANVIIRANHNLYPDNPAVVEKRYGNGTILLFNFDYQDSPSTPGVPEIIEAVVRYAANPVNWIRFDAKTDTIAANSSKNYDVTLLANFCDTRRTNLVMTTSDTTDSLFSIPVQLTVNGIPKMTLDQETVAFTNVYFGNSDSATVQIFNPGCDTLRIASILGTDAVNYSLNDLPTIVNPKSSASFKIKFTPTDSGTYENTITITSNASSNPVQTIAVTGISVYVPVAFLTTDTLRTMIPEFTTDTLYWELVNNGLANLIWSISESRSWLGLGQFSGTLVAGDTILIPVYFFAGNTTVPYNEYNFRINTNDPDRPQVNVTYILEVDFDPHIETTSQDTVFVSDVFVGDTVAAGFTIVNSGGDTLKITDIDASDENAFTEVETPVIIPPYGNFEFTGYYSSNSVGSYEFDLTLTSNDPDHPTYVVPFAGGVFNPPIASIDVNELTFAINSGDSETKEIIISNSGGYPLTYSVLGEEIQDANPAKRYIPKPVTATPKFTEDDLRQSSTNGAVVAKQASMKSKQANATTLLMAGTSTTNSVERALNELGIAFDKVTSYISPIPDFSAYDIIILAMDGGFWSDQLIADMRAAVEAGKKVIQLGGAGTTTFTTSYNTHFFETTYVGWNISATPHMVQVNGASPLAIGLPTQYTFTNSSASYSMVNVTDPAIKIAYQNGSGRPNLFSFKSFVWFTNSAQDSYWSNESDFAIMKQVIKNAIEFFDVSWLRPEPPAGVVAVGASDTVRFTATKGQYCDTTVTANIYFTSNDPVNDSIPATATVTITPVPNIRVEADTLAIADVRVGQSDTVPYVIRNVGCQDLIISSITFSGNAILADTNAFTIKPDTTQTIQVIFSPSTRGDFSQTMTINSNDADAGTYDVIVTAAGYVPQDISVNGGPFTFNLLSGQEGSATFMITNDGDRPLNYKISTNDTINVQQKVIRENHWVPVEHSHVPASGKMGDEKITKIINHSKTNEDKILLLANGSSDMRSQIASTGVFQMENMDYMSGTGSDFSIADIRGYRAIIVWTNTAFNYSELVGNVLKQYVDEGGGVVLATYAISSNWALAGGIFNVGYSPTLPNQSGYLTGGVVNGAQEIDESASDVSHPLFEGIDGVIRHWYNGNYAAQILQGGAQVIARDKSGNVTASENADGTVVALTMFPGNLGDFNDNGRRFMANAIEYVAGGGRFRFDPRNASVAPGETITVNLTARATSLPDTTINTNVVIESNDPVDSLVTIGLTMTVTAAPALSVTDTVKYNTLEPGETETKTVQISNSGSAPLTVSSISLSGRGFSANFESDTVLAAGDSYSIDVTFSDTVDGNYSGTMTVVSNAPVNSTQTAVLIAAVATPPEFTVDSNNLMFYAGNNNTQSKSLTIENTGGGILEMELFVGNGNISKTKSTFAKDYPYLPDENFTVTLSDDMLAAGETAILTVQISTADLAFGTYYGYFEIETNTDDGNDIFKQQGYVYFDFLVEIFDYNQPTVTFRPLYSTEPSLSNRVKFFMTTDAENMVGAPTLTNVNTGSSIDLTLTSGDAYVHEETISNLGNQSFRVDIEDITQTVTSSTINFNLSLFKADQDNQIIMNPNLTVSSTKATFLSDAYVINETVNIQLVDDSKAFVSSPFKVTSASILNKALTYRYTIADDNPYHDRSEKVGLYKLDEATGEWTIYDGQGRNNYVEAEIEHFGTYVFMYDENFQPLPNSFVLGQNYPNPFNPTTTIPFYVPSKNRVNISVFNVLGQKVATLVNREFTKGQHSVTWNAVNSAKNKLPSGIYYYRVSAGSNTITKKMILIK